jgi:hypothetical protein
MSTIGQKFSYEGPEGLCSVIVIKGGRILETRRDGKTFIKSDTPSDAHFSNGKQCKWANEEEWRASLPAGTVTRPPHAPTDEEVLARATELITTDHDMTADYQRAETLQAEFGIPYVRAWETLDRAWYSAPPAPAPAPAPAADTLLTEAERESVFFERGRSYHATTLVKKPTAKDEAWASRDRAAYDTADPAPRWGLPPDGLFLWLAVQQDDAFIPVCRYTGGGQRILRFYVAGELLTMAEAGITAGAPLWRRKSEADPTLIRVT